MKGVAHWRERVVTPKTFLTGDHEPALSQVGKVPRCRRLWHLKNLDQVTHAELAVLKEMENAQPGPVREGPERSIDLIL